MLEPKLIYSKPLKNFTVDENYIYIIIEHCEDAGFPLRLARISKDNINNIEINYSFKIESDYLVLNNDDKFIYFNKDKSYSFSKLDKKYFRSPDKYNINYTVEKVLCDTNDDALYIRPYGSDIVKIDNKYDINSNYRKRSDLLSEKYDFLMDEGFVYYRFSDRICKLSKIDWYGKYESIYFNSSESTLKLMAMDNNYIYYYKQNGDLCKITKDFQNKTLIKNISVGNFLDVYDDYIYYSNSNDSYKIYRVKNDGSINEKIIDSPIFDLMIKPILYNNEIYYINSQDLHLYSIQLHKKNNIKFKIDGGMKNYDKGYCKINGQLKEIDKIWTKINGVLREV